MISFEEFTALAQQYNIIPLEQSLMADVLTPVSTYLTMRRGDVASFLLESVEPNEKIGRYSFVGVEPQYVVRSRGGEVAIWRNGVSETRSANIFDVLDELSAQYRQAPLEQHVGFTGGLVGYIGYECVQHIEPLQPRHITEHDEDDAMLGLFDTVIRFDHRNQRITIVVNVSLDDARPLDEQYEQAKKKLHATVLRMRNSTIPTMNFSCSNPSQDVVHDRQMFENAVRRSKDHIVEGDIFQVVLSRRTQLEFSGDPFAVYRALRIINPSPYLFYLNFGGTRLIGSSPEVLVRCINGSVELLPIAGTRRRGRSEQEDIQLEEELARDEKELAEHLMLVDLGRNDIGRICEYGTVHVPVFKKIERYSHVMHIVSEVKGTLRAGKRAVDVLKACFPAGTVSGAPKVRAMEIINELEGKRRGVYAGAVGYIGFDGSMDTCIAIRTIVAHKNLLSVQAGAGIVEGSVPESEFNETVNKAQALFDAITLASNGLQL